MSPCVGAGDGPAVLQLQKWDHLRFQVEPSEYCLASISPTRDLLLLLSYQFEALLFPLIFDKDESGKFYSEAILEPNPPEHASTQRPDPDCARYSNATEEIGKGTVFPNRGYALSSEHYPVISGVKSLAWGHCGDVHNQYEDSGFREILIVSGDNGIIIHAFRDPNRNEVFKSAPEYETVHGKWVEWGPTCREVKGFLHSRTYETSESVNVHGTVRDGVSSNKSILPKKWLQTFTTKLDTVVCNGKYLTRFPPKSSLHLSADVVSFDIYDSTFKFLEFFSSFTLHGKGNLRDGTVVGKVDGASFSDLPSEVSTEPGTGLVHYRCSRVFNNSSHNLIGLVLNFPENVSGENTEARIRNAGQNYVVVMMLNPWGLQWVCSVDLQDNYSCPGPSSEWADFQFLDDFLVCLNTSGLICMWGAKTGCLVARFDTLKSCGLDLKVCSGINEAMVYVNRDSPATTMNFSQNVDHNDVRGRETCAGEIVCARTFRKLMVISHSFLLAVIDEQGVIYVICAAKYVLEKCGAVRSFAHPYNYSDCGMLAGCEIGRQKPLSDLSPCPGSYISTQFIRDSPYTKGSQRYNHSSEFSTFSPLNGLKISHPEHKITAAPLRKVFLPLNRYNKEDSVCFSPFGITRLVRSCSGKQPNNYKIVHTTLHVVSPVLDDRDLDVPCMSKCCSSSEEVIFSGDSIGCCFQGCLYLVTQDGLSVILPSVSVSSSFRPADFIRYWQPNTTATSGSQIKILLATDEFKELGMPWQIEVLDRTLLHEGPEEAERICLENGWDLKIARMRRLQLSLHYLKSDEIEKSLDMLVDVNLAEDGILCLLFTSVRRIFCKAGSDSEVALASRLLALAASFATKMVRKYWLEEHKKELLYDVKKDLGVSCVQLLLKKHVFDEISNSRRLYEMARFLEVIRILQSRQISKTRGLGQALAGGTEAANVGDADALQDGSLLPVAKMDSVSHGLLNTSEAQAKIESSQTSSEPAFDSSKQLALLPKESADGEANLHEFNDADIVHRKKTISLENPTYMIARWGLDNLDLKAIVKDALDSGRLPLAVLQLHLLRRKELVSANKPHDIFNEISEIGRAIAYDLFLKGESELAVSTLLRLGEDVEVILRELLFGTVRRSLRKQIAEATKKYGNLRPHEWKTLERISVIERLYPSCSFWKTFLERQKDNLGDSSSFTSPAANNLKLNFCVHDNLTIECGDIDGVVADSWINVGGGSPEVCEDSPHAAYYWACAAIWCDAWDQRIVDRILLDQPCHEDVHAAWESQFDYHMSHNGWEKVFKLLDVIPTSMLSEGSLEINLNSSPSAANMSTNFPYHAMYICADGEELEPMFMDVPDVRIFRSSTVSTCSSWLKMLVEQELAKKFIFLKEYWESTAEIMPLLVRAGLIIDACKISLKDEPSMNSLDLTVLDMGSKPHKDAGEALHKLVVHYCTQYNLPNLLDLYIDHCNLVHDDDSFSPFLNAAGDCQWAKWLLFSRIKGHEYEASLSNARSNLSRQMVLGGNLSVLEIDEIIHTVDDMAEGGGEMAALATLMYAAAPLQECVCAGSVNRHCSFSSQCTLENLRPTLQHFPTLWRTLVNACFGQDDNNCSLNSNTANVFGNSALSDYLKWRDTIFSSSGGDTSLIQMLPCWFPKSIRRLVTLLFQGPLGLQFLSGSVPCGQSSFYRENAYAISTTGNAGFSPINWEAAIQRSIEELYSSLEDKGFGVEHYLHRGRALAAFNHILGIRASKLKSNHVHKELSGQNIQSDLQAILAPMSESEVSPLSSVIPLAIMHFEDSVLVASCTFLLELCGLPANLLRVDVAVLQRISSYYNSIGHNAQLGHISPRGSSIHAGSYESDITLSVVQALADNHIHHDHLNILDQRRDSCKFSKGKQSPHSLITVLQHLEKSSLPLIEEGKTCGFWLSCGCGDGYEFRSQQKDASLQWKLVTAFCQMHHLPLSTKYLALLASDNDWVGFLTEAQMGGFSNDIIIEVAAKEFKDPRLKTHVLTVLKSVQSARKNTNSSSTNGLAPGRDEMPPAPDSKTMVPMELFGLLADCERQKYPGEALLTKAKDLRWPLLAMIASCFSDVSPLSCMIVWLEITTARETSSIKVNDISSKIANNIRAAVEATNKLPSGSRNLVFRYNRRNPKRRRLMEHASGESRVNGSFDNPGIPSSMAASIPQEIGTEERNEMFIEKSKISIDSDEGLECLSNMTAVLCEQHLFHPLLRAFEMFLPSCSLLPFVRSLQAFSQMRLSEASAHLASFSVRIKEEPLLLHSNVARDGLVKSSWISSTAAKAAEAMLLTCPSAYEKRCLLQLLAAVDFGDGGSASAYFRRLYWKIDLAEPFLRKDEDAYLGTETLDDASLLAALEANGRWEQARNWAWQLESSGTSWKAAVHHVTEAQAEAMVVEWKEYLWDVPEERAALWGHCQTLFVRYSFPSLQAGLFFLKHAEAIEKEIPAKELHEMLLLSLQWLSGTMTKSSPVYPLHLLREIETRVWLLAVESEAQSKAEGDFILPNSVQNIVAGTSTSFIEQTACVITKMDAHINAMWSRPPERNMTRENNAPHSRYLQFGDSHSSVTATSSSRAKRRSKTYIQQRRPTEIAENTSDTDDYLNLPHNIRTSGEVSKDLQLLEGNTQIETSISGWEEKVRPAEVERAILSLLEFGQITAAKQLQLKLSPAYILPELIIVNAALKVADLSSSSSSGEINKSELDAEVLSVVQSLPAVSNSHIDLLQVLESLAAKCGQGCGYGFCWRIIAVVKAAKVLGLTFSEAFGKRPIELLQLLSLKAQESLEEAKLLVQTHSMSSPSIARILAESFLKGLLAAHRGGYMDSQREEGPAPLLWRFSDFLKWAELCPSEQEIGHALMRLVMTGQEIPHACEVELLILSHHFYKSSACLDGVDVLVTLAANRVESYVSEGDFSCLARLITGVSNFHALNFILNILIENGQLDLLLQKYSTADTGTATSEAVRGFRLSVLTSLKLFNPHDLDAFAMVYHHFDMKHETASLLEFRSMHHVHQWFSLRYRERQTEDLLDAMRYIIEAAEVYSSIDAGHKTYRACARASLLSLQIRIPDLHWLELSETNARRAFVEQSRFQEALIVAEAYDLNQPSEWAPVLWNLMLKPDLIEEFVAEFVMVLPLQPSMLLELARFYRAEVAARGDQSHFSVWLSPGGLPAEWVKHLGKSFRSLLKRTRDLRVRLQLATIATGFGDVVDSCSKVLDRVSENASPLILRRGHGGAYLPLM